MIYDPLDKENLAESIVRTLLRRRPAHLPPRESVSGAGIYLLYYTGSCPWYAPLAEKNRNERFGAPIYVGKAVPAGRRKGRIDESAEDSTALAGRLREHADSIRATKSLRLIDFSCRYLDTDEIWIALAERLLIERYAPLWNTTVEGFGIHDPGTKGRGSQRISPWDTIHPGRSFTKGHPSNHKTKDEILESLRVSLAGEWLQAMKRREGTSS